MPRRLGDILKKDLFRGRYIRLFCTIVVLSGILALVYKATENPILSGNTINREEVVVDTKVCGIVELEEGQTEKIQVKVCERIPDRLECKNLLDQAEALIKEDKVYLGNNNSEVEICEDLNLPDCLLNNQVICEWRFIPADVISPDGRLLEEDSIKQIQQVTAGVMLSIGEQSRQIQIPLVIVPKAISEKEKELNAVIVEINQLEEETRSEKQLELPTELSGHKVTWQKKQSKTPIFLCLGIIVGIIAVITSRKEEENKVKKRQEQLRHQYPDLVSKLTILLGAGMSGRRALECVEKSLSDPVRKEMIRTSNEMKQGVIEIKAYEEMGQRIGLRCYKKLAMLLEQNLRLGSSDLQLLLDREVQEAYQEWEHEYEKEGEKVATKMLIPMMMLLIVVLFLVVLPAFIGMRS